jgi:hypothetical protein
VNLLNLKELHGKITRRNKVSLTLIGIFKVGIEYEDEFGKIHPHVLSVAETVWLKSENFFSNIIQDHQQRLKILLHATALVSQKYSSGETQIENLTAYLYSTFRRLILADANRQKRHSELQTEAAKHQIEAKFVSEDEKICQKILVNQIRARMDDWTREVFDLQTIGYQYKDLIPKYGISENRIRSKYSKNILKLKNDIQAEMASIEKELNI